MATLSVPQGQFRLSRFPKRVQEPLRAWDAADEYLLHTLAEQSLTQKMPRTLLINDNFGALAVALSEYQPTTLSDSYLSQQGTLSNLQESGIDPDRVTFCDSLNWPQGAFDLIIIKIPKSLAMLEDQLYRLRPLLNEQSQVIASAMCKQIHRSTLKLFERIIGSTHTSLAQKKARLIFSQPDNPLMAGETPYPKHYTLEGTDFTLVNHANVFSQASLDIGSRFFLAHLPKDIGQKRVVDLGCGNGVIGLIAAQYNPEATLFFVDESYMAVRSAEENFKAAFPQREAQFEVMNCLTKVKTATVDLILNNPPFHQNSAVSGHIAWQMFKQSLAALRSGGELWVIGNRHLDYHIRLKKLFGNCKVVSSNKKFVILKSVKKSPAS
ncbi:MAG: methyltransferase [Gammaproteobacteria bacterium]|nr:methyltransferase [Gammaproteobacteria bacterium]MCF6231350.1 methyltransferase [Gammaproteobacteria bacterium]